MAIVWLRVLYVSAVFYIAKTLLIWTKYFSLNSVIGLVEMIALTGLILFFFRFSTFRSVLKILEKKDSYNEDYKISKVTFVATLLLFSHVLLTLYGFLKETM